MWKEIIQGVDKIFGGWKDVGWGYQYAYQANMLKLAKYWP